MSDLREIALASIDVGDRFRVDLGDVGALAESIESSGYTQPILVSEAGDRYTLIDGGRRLAAYELLGRMLIPAIVRPQVTDDEVALLEAVTNSHRKGWTPSEAAAKAAQIEQLLAEGRLDEVGSLPTAGERRSAWVARMVGYRDRTLRDARQLVEYEATTVDGQILCDRLVAQMDEAGQVSGPHRQWRGVRTLEVLAGHDDAEISKMATGALARALDDTTVDIAAEADGLASYAEVEIKDETAGVDPGDATPDEPAAEAVSRGRGSDAESRQASEPSLLDDLRAFGCRQCGVIVDRGFDSPGSLTICPRCDGDQWYRPDYPVGPFGWDRDCVVLRTVPALDDGDAALVVCDHCDTAVFVPPATGYDLLLGACPACSRVDWTACTLDGTEVPDGGNVEPWLDAELGGTPNQAGGDDDADGKGSAGPSEMATEHDASAAPSADDEGESASELPATSGGARPAGWPPRAESHPSLTGMTEAGFRSGAAFYAAARVLMDWILDGDTPEEAVGRYQDGPQRLTSAQLDYVLAHFDVPAPAPVSPIGGSESPAPRGGVNGPLAAEGGELVPDPSTVVEPVEGSVEGEEFGTVPATVPTADGEPEIRRSGSPSTTHLPRRKEHSSPPVMTTAMLDLVEALETAAAKIGAIAPSEVDRALGAHSGGEALGGRIVAAVDLLTDLMPGVRFVARPV